MKNLCDKLVYLQRLDRSLLTVLLPVCHVFHYLQVILVFCKGVAGRVVLKLIWKVNVC